MANVGTLYSQLSPLSFSAEFTPSRVTRVSSNPFLQEHCPFSTARSDLENRRKAGNLCGGRGSSNQPTRQYSALTQRKYIQLEFSDDTQQKPSTDSIEDCYSTIRRYRGSYHPESVIGYTTDFLFEEDGADELSTSYPGTRITQSSRGSDDPLMERPISFTLAIGENPILFDCEDESGALIPPHNTVELRPEETRAANEHEVQDDLYQNICSSPVDRSHSPCSGLPKDNTHGRRIHSAPCHSSGANTNDISEIPFYCNILADYDQAHHVIPPGVLLSQEDMLLTPLPPPAITFAGNLSSSNKICASMENIRTDQISASSDIVASSSADDSGNMTSSTTITKYNSTSTPNLLDQPNASPIKGSDHSSELDHFSLQLSDSGESYGSYHLSYLGSKNVNSYSNSIDECAKKMLDPKSPVLLSDDINVEITFGKIRFLKPKSGALLKSISMHDVFMFSQCTKNKRLVGILVWKRNTLAPVCHLFRCSDQLLSNAFMESLASAKQDSDYQLMEKLSSTSQNHDVESDLSLSLSSSFEVSVTDVLHKWPAVHVATMKVGKAQTVGSILKKAISERNPSESNVVSVWVSLAQIRLVQMIGKKQLMYGHHAIDNVEAIGADQNDKRLIGYIVKEKNKPSIAYVIWCYTAAEAGAMISFLRQACQSVYHQKRKDPVGQVEEGENDEKEIGEDQSSTMSTSRKGFLSLFRSLKPSVRPIGGGSVTSSGSPLQSPLTCSSSSFQSYLSSQQISSTTVADVPQKRKNSVIVPKPVSSFESADDNYAKFTVTYIGSANMSGPFSSHSITKSLEMFSEGGVAVGAALVPKNTIVMHVSSLGINLTDKKQKMFINRNYPQKQILGHSMHSVNEEYFGFATSRPGFKDQIKVHVFCQLVEPVQQVLDAMIFWLNLPKTQLS